MSAQKKIKQKNKIRIMILSKSLVEIDFKSSKDNSVKKFTNI